MTGLTLTDAVFFLLFFGIVVGVSVYKSRRETTGEAYFLAGRGLTWPLIGLSMIAANISTEQFVGMAGQGAGIAGLAVASYEWLSAVGLVVVAVVFLPRFLRAGIYTIPEYLEYRYDSTTRLLMALYSMLVYVGVTIAAVIYTGALNINAIFDVKIESAVWVIGGVSALYTVAGGLKAVAWADLFQGSAIIAGGLVTMVVGFDAVGGVRSFFAANAGRLHLILPSNHAVLPWTTLVFGLWIPVFYYWGLNQFIIQRTLAARNLSEGQRGVMFAALLKLLIPFIIILPGIMALQLYPAQLTGAGRTTDAAYPLLVRNLMSPALRGFIFAAIFGAVISTVGSMLNSAATIFSLDLYKRYLNPRVREERLPWIGRAATAVFVVAGCLIAPRLSSPGFKGIFNYMQEFQGFLSPGVLAAFLFGLVVPRAPAASGVAALVASPVVYLLLYVFAGGVPFLNRMAITFAVVVALMAAVTLARPLPAARAMPVRGNAEATAVSVKILGAVIVAVTTALYWLFW
ncbi:MAG: SLC5 family protein [Bacteroidales bacterium]